MVAIGESLKLTRADLLGFPGDTVDLIMEMQKDGWRAQRSSRSHVALLAPDGKTRLGASQNPNSHKYLSQALRSYQKKQDKEEVVEKKVTKVAQKWPCPRPTCHKTFASEEKLSVHISVDHEGLLKCPSCDKVFKRPASLGVHRYQAHGYESPTRARRKEIEAEKQKLLEDLKSQDTLITVPEGEVVEVIVATEKVKPLYVAPGVDAEIPLLTDPWEPKAEVPTLVQHNVSPATVSPADIAKQVTRQLSAIESAPDKKGDDYVPFIDERDSWTIDIELLGRMRIGNLKEMLKATGLNMEIRVWKD